MLVKYNSLSGRVRHPVHHHAAAAVRVPVVAGLDPPPARVHQLAVRVQGDHGAGGGAPAARPGVAAVAAAHSPAVRRGLQRVYILHRQHGSRLEDAVFPFFLFPT